MKTKLFYLIIALFGFGVNAQNPFAEMLKDPATRAIIDIDIPTRDQVIADDLIVLGSACVGLDCVNGESFGFDTIRLKENNLRINFFDTSNTGSFPTRDWRIVINDSSNGGANYFGIEDTDAGTQPFRVEAGAGAAALWVSDSGGNVGLGTTTPVVELHINDGDTPTMRLEQNGSSGFTPQTWDMAGNETNFFIRDVTNGSRLPFRIRPGANTSTIDVGAASTVSINGAYSNPNISINLEANNRGMLLNRMDNAGRTALGALLTAAEAGTIIYDTEDLQSYLWDGSAWTTSAGGTDDQTLTLNVNSLDLEDGGSVDLTPYLDNTDDQALTLNVNSLDLEDGGSVDLSNYLDNTDDQNISGSGFAANMLTIGIESGASEIIDLSSLDNSGTDDQQLMLAGNSLNLEDGGSVDLSNYLDNTDDQNISGSGFAANMLTIGIESGASEIIDLSSLDNSGTDDQQLMLAGNSLNLEDGGSVDLSGYLDNTDNQNISGSGLAANILTIGISGGSSENVDLSVFNNSGTDDQQLTLSGNSLNLEDGGSVDLSGYLDNTDNQNLSNFILSGPLLSIAVTGGNSITVNLSPLLQDLEDENAAQQAQINAILAVNVAQQAQIDDLIARMEAREQCECNGPLGVGDFEVPNDKALLMQNIPNPFDNSTSIGYFIPFIYSKANIVISATTGQILENRQINKFGEGAINVNKDLMSSGIYYYTLFVDGSKVDTKRMIVE